MREFNWMSPSIDGQCFFFRNSATQGLVLQMRSENNDFDFSNDFGDFSRPSSLDTSFYDMKQLLDGKLVFISPENGSLCIFSSDFHFVEKIECSCFRPLEESLAARISFSSFGHDPNILLWNSGSNHFTIVDMGTNQLEDISLNLNPSWQVFCGLTVFRGRKAAVLWRDEDLQFGASYWARSDFKPLSTCKKTALEIDSRRNLM